LHENCVERIFFFLKLEFELSKVDLFRNLLLQSKNFSQNNSSLALAFSRNNEGLQTHNTIQKVVSLGNLGCNFCIRMLTKSDSWIIAIMHQVLYLVLEDLRLDEVGLFSLKIALIESIAVVILLSAWGTPPFNRDEIVIENLSSIYFN